MERCIVCEQEKQAGIHLYRLFICTDCELAMVHTEPGEALYDYYVHKLKQHQGALLYS